MILLFLSMLNLAMADAGQDLRQAADSRLSQSDRMDAFGALVRLGQEDLDLVLRVAGSGDADARQRWVAIRVLGKVGGASARSALLQEAKDPEPAMRAAAAQAMGDLGDAATREALEALLQDPAIIVRSAAAQGLGSLALASSVPALSDAFDAKDNFYRGESLWVRAHYVAAMGRIRDMSALPALLRALDDADPAVVQASVGALETISGFSYAEGRNGPEEQAAWRRWGQSKLR